MSANSQILVCLSVLSESISSTSIFIAFLAGPCAVELTTSSVSLSPPPLESGAVQLDTNGSSYVAYLVNIHAGTSVNLQFAKLERRIYGA